MYRARGGPAAGCASRRRTAWPRGSRRRAVCKPSPARRTELQRWARRAGVWADAGRLHVVNGARAHWGGEGHVRQHSAEHSFWAQRSFDACIRAEVLPALELVFVNTRQLERVRRAAPAGGSSGLAPAGCVTPGSCRRYSRSSFSRTFALSVFARHARVPLAGADDSSPSSHPHRHARPEILAMLRSSLRTARVLGGTPLAAAAARQWPTAASRRAGVAASVRRPGRRRGERNARHVVDAC